jgi:hypothetical protein
MVDAALRRPAASLALSKSEVALSKREVSGGWRMQMSSTIDLPSLRYARGQPSFAAGTNVVPALLGRNPDELENSEDCGSAGGHGNQHVRLRGASIDASKRSARLSQRLLPRAGQAVRSQGSLPVPAAVQGECYRRGRESPVDLRHKAIRRYFFFSCLSTCSHGSPTAPASC